LPEQRFTIEGVEPVLLFGFNDAFLRRIEDAFPDTQVVARGRQVLVRGEAETLGRVQRVFDELVGLVERNGHLTERDVDTVLALVTSREPRRTRRATGGGPEGAVIVHTPDGEAIRPRTPNQAKLVEAARSNDVVFAIGPAGTGKTYVAVALAVAALRAREVKRIVLARPAVEAGEQLGFLPGDFYEKIDPYLRPLYDALGDMLARDKLAQYLEEGRVEIVPLAYMRGRTLKEAFVIMDEAQNATTGQMKMFLTRLGPQSRTIVTGDVTQTDLKSRRQSGLVQVQEILSGIRGIDFVYLDRRDVVRHRLVKDIIAAYEKHVGE
jgi:phosphate starvation-inducible PhoH-like protein